MKTRKWIWWTLAVIFTLAALTAAGIAGYRIGYMQGLTANPNAKDFAAGPFWHEQGRGQNPDKNFDQRNPIPAQKPGEKQKDRFDGRDRLALPLAGLGRLLVLGLIIWLGYKLVTGMAGKQGWQLALTFNTKDADESAAVEKVEAKKAKK
ncbi:MAG: hypothetical protein MUO77_07010 [Anaerolineales bacterium]|nr:hypothetical protein [Anaerolineales bacterium]